MKFKITHPCTPPRRGLFLITLLGEDYFFNSPLGRGAGVGFSYN